ncbi:zinc finger protein, putative [Plasmodium reichenowi]|uniref:Zinc finger protein, putative n=1 Tax=Plasmodium reichenowi TaxID=5854 RepID=A0A151LSF6_PLARE|nr:zinc finger protein, putative [Plasmodium reichenowi]KYO02079.1 zinc finger protein, putative [Plasmodium reichenowi]
MSEDIKYIELNNNINNRKENNIVNSISIPTDNSNLNIWSKVDNVCDVKNIYNIKKEDVIIEEYMDINKSSTINLDHNKQVNIYIENSDLNKKIYTCHTCNIQIYNYSFFRYHFKSEWHKYNLKRKLLNLHSVNEFVFNEKLKNLKKNEDQENQKKDKRENQGSHLSHKKRNESNKKKKEKNITNFNNINNNNNNVTKSNNHTNEHNNHSNVSSSSNNNNIKYATKENVLLTKNIKYDNPAVCFFDNRIFNSIEENIKHMNDTYTFYIPDLKYVTNVKKILLTIGKKIYEENICIYCFKYAKCVKSLQAHMVCKSHTKLHTNFMVYIQKYYDFSKTYVDLLNKYINNKQDKKLLLYMLNHEQNKDKQLQIHDNKNQNHLNENHLENNNVLTKKKLCNDTDNNSDDYPNDGYILKKENNQDTSLSNSYDNHDHTSDDNNSDDYKIKETDLNKNIDYNKIYQVLEEFGYIKPELNEYNNLILPDGSEAINRKLAYIFKQKLPLENKTNFSSKYHQIDVLKNKKDKHLQQRKYKYYIDIMKKYNLNLNLKTNNLNKFYKSDSIFFL